MKESEIAAQRTLFGHPTGLYTLFFAEMWERFSYYGMRALLLLYMLKGFLGYGDKDANAVYGAYTALVYMTPFFGGMIADKLLGARACVVIGGLLMASGHLLMTIQQDLWFFTALGLLIAGNGFFKPNISTIVGSLYPPGSPKRDGGFTIFYIGINLGAAMAPLLCGYIGETYGWHKGFGLATIGMLVGTAIFVAPTILTQLLILSAAALSGYLLLFYNSGDPYSFWLGNAFVFVALIISAGAAITALTRGGLPSWAGAPPDLSRFYPNLFKVIVGTAVVIPIFVVLVSGISVIPGVNEQVTLIPEQTIKPLEESDSKLVRGIATFVEEASRPAGLVLILAGLGASIYLLREAFRMDKIARERMFVVFILTFFSLLFWSFFEQSGSSLNNFTDRNVDRVFEQRSVTNDDVGQTVELSVLADPSDSSLADLDFLSQEYLGHENGAESVKEQVANAVKAVDGAKEADKQMSAEKLQKTIEALNAQPKLTMTTLTFLREFAKSEDATPADQKIEWTFTEGNVDNIGLEGNEIPASVFQAVNPIFIMVFGLVFTILWGFLGSRGMEPSTPVKFAFGLIQLGAGFGLLFVGAQYSVDGMVAAYWIILMYLLMTTGELCLSPVGLSMVTKLSPTRLVSTVMGSWFLATAFSQFLAAIIAQFAAVDTGELNIVPIPAETVHIYGDLYQLVAYLAIGSGVFCLILSPILKRWMHQGEKSKEDE